MVRGGKQQKAVQKKLDYNWETLLCIDKVLVLYKKNPCILAIYNNIII